MFQRKCFYGKKISWNDLLKESGEKEKLIEDSGENRKILLNCPELNKKIFEKDSKGHLIKDKKGNLTKINYDNP